MFVLVTIQLFYHSTTMNPKATLNVIKTKLKSQTLTIFPCVISFLRFLKHNLTNQPEGQQMGASAGVHVSHSRARR